MMTLLWVTAVALAALYLLIGCVWAFGVVGRIGASLFKRAVAGVVIVPFWPVVLLLYYLNIANIPGMFNPDIQ